MRAKELLLKLIDIERAIGFEEPFKIREMVMQAQEYTLALQKSLAEQLPQQRLAPVRETALSAHEYRNAQYATRDRDF